MPFIGIILTPMIVDEICGEKNIHRLITLAAVLIVTECILGILQDGLNCQLSKYQERLSNYFTMQIGMHSMNLDFQLTEDKAALDQLDRAKTGMTWYSGGVYGIAEQVFMFFGNIFKIVGFITIIALNAPWMLLFITLFVIANSFVTAKCNKVDIEAFNRLSKVNRLFGYFGWTIVSFRYGKDVRLYELGNVYRPKALPLTELPEERMHFTLGMYGNGDFFDMKGVCEEFFEKIGMKKKMEYDPASKKAFLHPGRQADMVYEGTVVGYLGEVHPLVADNYGIGERAYIAMIDIKSVLEFANFDRKFTGIAKYPAVTRDISMLVPKQVLAGQIEDILAQRGGKILESYQLFDIYEGSQIKGGYKSMAYALVFRDHDKTLEESEISAAMKKILNGLEGLGIELRS